MDDKKITPQELKAALNGNIDRLVEQSIRCEQYGPNWTSEDCTDQTVIRGVRAVRKAGPKSSPNTTPARADVRMARPSAPCPQP